MRCSEGMGRGVALCVAAAFVTAACATTVPVANAPSVPAQSTASPATASPAQSVASSEPASPSTAPSAAPTPPPISTPAPAAAASPPCKLPVVLDSGAALLDITAASIGSGTFAATADPTAAQVELPNRQGKLGQSYDWAIKRWLPVPAQFVAPDGAKYAYTDAQSQIHVVTIAGGADRVITTSGTWGLYGYTVNGVYAGRPDPAGTGLTGLWVFGPDGGSTVQLVDNGTWLLVGNDAAWSLASVGPAPTGANVLGNAVGTKLVKLNLATGQQQAWYLSTNGNVGMAALDRLGRPVLVDVDNGSVLVVTAQDSASTVFSGGLPLSVMADAHGIWIGHPFTLSIYLSSDGSSASRWGQYGYNGTIQFAGGCG